MTKPIGAITQTLLESHPDDWLAMMGLGKAGPVRVLDSELSTVSAGADKVLRVDLDPPWLVKVEVQAGYDPDLPRRPLRYNALLDVRHRLPVHSVVVLLWPEAGGGRPGDHGGVRAGVASRWASGLVSLSGRVCAGAAGR